ncbi:MAG: DUF11 domain-containing protein [Propionibacteriaceae bacterium]|nr:DUF11 domain-containing protein [Propionibacteriaceae bacterium]
MTAIRSIRRRAGLIALTAVVLIASLLTGQPPNSQAAPTASATKSAHVVRTGDNGQGSATLPIPVQLNDQIEYTLTIDNPLPPEEVRPHYDVLFLLDWSASLFSGYEKGEMYPHLKDPNRSAYMRAKTTIENVSLNVFQRYPDSRIALMGMNSNERNTEDPTKSYIQVDTDFVGPDLYRQVIKNAFSTKPQLRYDDAVTFLKAANDKMMGDATTYGGHTTTDSVTAPVVTVKPRLDRSRTPVIVFISDYEFGMGEPEGSKEVWGGDWDAFNAQASRFKNAYPDGIFLGARTDTAEVTGKFPHLFGNPAHDAKMDSTFVTLGGSEQGQQRWGWVKFTAGQTPDQQDSLLYNLITDKAPPAPYGGSVIDTLPPGLVHVSSTPSGKVTTVQGRDQVRWDYLNMPTGQTVIKVVAKVTGYGTYMNQAQVLIGQEVDLTTNATYHRTAAPYKIHLRQMVLERSNSPVELPQVGYMTLANADVSRSLTSTSGVEGVGSTAFTTYSFLPPSSDDRTVLITDIVPQYYELAGYFSSIRETPHDPARLKTGPISLDFRTRREQWVTVYIKPLATAPGDYTWDTRVNSFGRVEPNP